MLYVSDDFTFRNMVSLTNVFSTIHRWNSLLCPPLGFWLNLLLLWLILHRTPQEMVVHSRVLLQTCLLDFAILSLQAVAQITYAVDQQNKQFIFVLDGLLARVFPAVFTPDVQFGTMPFWSSLYNLSVFGIAAQFLYRYMVLNRDKKVLLGRYLLLLFVPTMPANLYHAYLGWTLGTAFTMHQYASLSYGLIPAAAAAAEEQQQQPLIMKISVEYESTTYYTLFTIVLSLQCIIAYATILFCGWKMVQFVGQHATFNARLKELNRQLTRNLIICFKKQALFPLLLDLLWLPYFVIWVHNQQQFDSDSTVQLQLYMFLLIHWLPVLNPLASILTNRPYRNSMNGWSRKLMTKLLSLRCKQNANAVVPMQNAQAQPSGNVC